jgi:putative transposase
MIPYQERLNMIGRDNTLLSLRSRCMLMSVSRSSMYYDKKNKQESPLNLEIMHLMDKMYLDHPEFGPFRMHTWLTIDKGF